jgi:hypothetical protein
LPYLLFTVLFIAADPIPIQIRNGFEYTDTISEVLVLSPPQMRFSQSSDHVTLLSGVTQHGFATNPAVLGMAQGGNNHTELTTQYSARMPMLNLPDFYEISQSLSIAKLGSQNWGFGISRRAMGIGYDSKVVEYSLGIGHAFDTSGFFKHSIGASLKIMTSEGFRGEGNENPSMGLFTDIGYLVSLGSYFRFGVVSENMGQGTRGVRPMVHRMYSPGRYGLYLTQESDPNHTLAPMAISLGAALIKKWNAGTLQVFDASLAGSWAKRPNSGDEEESYTTVVLGIGLFNTISFHAGFMRDPSSAELQGKLGLSLSLFNHIRITGNYLSATGGAEVFQSQKGFSLSLFNLQYWQHSDRTWWRIP